MDVIWLIFVVAMGLCVGSFLNVVIWRLPRGRSIVFPGSHCPQCGRSIRWYDNIPIVSWLALGGKCRFCKKPISPRYLLVEALTAALVAGLYACYFIFRLRDGAGAPSVAWPMFLAHATLVCGLLACSIVDIEMWIVPLEICWFVSLVGIVCATVAPHPFMPACSATGGAVAVAAAVGLAISFALLKMGLIQPSFIDAADSVVEEGGNKADGKSGRISSVAVGAEHGVRPRVEILRELLYLTPAIVLAVAAYLAATQIDSVRVALSRFHGEAAGGFFARRLVAFQSALLGYLVGGMWVWGMRIFGTLVFGKEAMGMGDVHLLAAVGAVTGWIVPSVAFFVAPFFGLLWALRLWFARKQRELPYGPWLGVATLTVMVFYDGFVGWLGQHFRNISYLWER